MTQQVTQDVLADAILTADAAGRAKMADSFVNAAKLAANAADSQSGHVVQVVNVLSGAVATGTTIIPIDDTIPQNTEGDQYMTLAITPKSATNKLKIEVVIQLSSSLASNQIIAALFQDTTANAIASGYQTQAANTGQITQLSFTHYMVAGTTSSTTFKVRAGGSSAATTTFNGSGGSRQFGGVLASSITITEIAA